MIRPLVWAAAALVLGEGGAACYLPGWSLWLLMIQWTAVIWFFDPDSGIAADRPLVCAGRRQISTFWCRFLYALPVFFILGYGLYTGAARAAEGDLAGQTDVRVSFEGKVDRVQEKEDRLILRISRPSLRISSEDKGQEALKSSGQDEGTCPGILVYADRQDAGEIREGYRIRGSGMLSRPDPPVCPGQFDLAGWYHSQGISYFLFPDTLQVTRQRISYRAVLSGIRRRIARVLTGLFDRETAGVLLAMLLGDRQLLDEDLSDLLQKLGISHILAISGLHVSLIGWGFFRLLRRLGMLPAPASLMAAFGVLSYGLLTGMGPSTLRAVIMFLAAMGAEYFARSYDMPCAMALAALIMFTGRPLLIRQSGVQFSCMAVLSLGILWPAMKKLLPRRAADHPLIAAAGPCVAAWLGTLPLTASYYGQIPLLSVPLNLIVLPLISLMMPLAVLTGCAGLFSMRAAAFLGGSVHTLLRLCIGICSFSGRFPLAIWRSGSSPVPVVILSYLLLGFFVILSHFSPERKEEDRIRVYGMKDRELDRILKRQKNRSLKTLRLFTLLGLALILVMIPWRSFGDFAWALDVGQGSCCVFRSGRYVWMMDGGSTDQDRVGERRLAPFLDYYGEEKVDYAFVSHGDEDHLSGIRELLQMKRVGHLVLGQASADDPGCRDLASLASDMQVPVIWLQAGDVWQDGDWHFSCLYPGRQIDTSDANDRSLVILAEWKDLRILLPGDISAEAEKEVLRTCSPGKVQILLCPHHGSRYSCSREFLQEVRPDLTIISCGAHNQYGHPARETLQRLKEAGSAVKCTRDVGSVQIR